MDVVFDPVKDAENIRKHGLSLARACDFAFDSAVVFVDDREAYGEIRYNLLGFLDASLCNLVITERDDTLRAISLRRCTSHERRRYAKETA